MNDEPPLFSGALADVVARYPYNACAYSRALANRSVPFRRQVDPDLHEKRVRRVAMASSNASPTACW